MFFYLSKIFWLLVQPVNLTGLLLLAAVVAQVVRWRRLAITASLGAFVVLGVSAWTSLGALMLHPLEDRFARPAALPETVDGIIVLGGGFEGAINRVRGGYELNSGGDRFVEAAIMARRYPNAKVVISGGSGALVLEGEADADTVPRLLEALGVSRDRMVLENRSRNTVENARFTRQLVAPGPSENWLLITSAFHMPRSVALFRREGFDVIAWPTDYRTTGQETIGLAQDNQIDTLQASSLAVREWIGLIAYRLTGRIDAILPAPDAGEAGK